MEALTDAAVDGGEDEFADGFLVGVDGEVRFYPCGGLALFVSDTDWTCHGEVAQEAMWAVEVDVVGAVAIGELRHIEIADVPVLAVVLDVGVREYVDGSGAMADETHVGIAAHGLDHLARLLEVEFQHHVIRWIKHLDMGDAILHGSSG